MLDTITYLLCERSVGSLIILIDIAIFLWYFVLIPLSPSCTLCNKKTSTVSLPCGNCFYCPSCLNSHVAHSCADPSRWPIRCCTTQQIPLRFISQHLTASNLSLAARRIGSWDVDHLVTLMSVEVTTVLLPKRPSLIATGALPGTYYPAYPYD
ncbi:hypothetical protein D6C85_04302 [Aureobasidium pullulans]|uniref:IBR domain-containing protein n=1 Tax=Aureobasidium pullulans TaxID=5580 RepID=A0A4S9X3Q1_AURPU|nr:hypothetical protein D6C85_04302 [Aureobasidium pullulans]